MNIHPMIARLLRGGTGISLSILLLTACAPSAPQTPTASSGSEARQLATLFVSPTPDEAARAATRAASRPTALPVLIPTTPPTATVYVGIFMGDAAAGGGIPQFDASRYEGTRVIVPTAAVELGCSIAVDTEYGVAWASDPALVRALGCAGEPATPYPGASQIFERGVMYWLPTNEFWAIAPATPRGRYWYFPEPPPDLPFPSDTVVPDGLRAPVSGFGTVWKAFADIRAGIGFARFEEASTQLVYQRFDNGALLLDRQDGQVWVLLRNGEVYGPFSG
ncbi:hypothetical protein FBR02_07130 [Anaerolineae bacterium CFX9]|nr:hypothetical protein [Anaerolineae bacterium CFX9]